MPRDIDATVKSEKNKEANQPIFLYTIHEYNGTDDLRLAEYDHDIVFAGLTYTTFPISHEFISENTQGEIASVKVQLSNVSRLIQAYLEDYDFRGKKVTIKRVWRDQLGDSDAYTEDVYYIDNYTADQKDVGFTLSSKFDVLDLELPARKYSRNYCAWKFKSSECFHPKQEILMENSIPKQIQDIKIGDKIINGKGNIDIVKNIGKRIVNNLYKVKIENIPGNLLITGNHPIKAVKRKEILCKIKKDKRDLTCSCLSDDMTKCNFCGRTFKEGNFIELKKLKQGDYVETGYCKNCFIDNYLDISHILREIGRSYLLKNNKIKLWCKYDKKLKWIPNKIKIDKNLMRFIGYYLSEGSNGQVISFAFHKKEDFYHQDVLNLGKNIFGLKGKLERKKNQKCVCIIFNSKLLSLIMEYLCGKNSWGKKIHPIILYNSEKRLLLELIKGAFRGDGYLKPKQKINNYYLGIELSTISKFLAWQYRNILMKNNIKCCLNKDKDTNVYNLLINGKNGNELAKQFFNKETHYNSYVRGFRAKNFLYCRISKITKINYKGFVYNLEINNNPSYLANGIIVHNCGYAGAETTCNKTLTRCRALGNQLRFGGFPSVPSKRIFSSW